MTQRFDAERAHAERPALTGHETRLPLTFTGYTAYDAGDSLRRALFAPCTLLEAWRQIVGLGNCALVRIHDDDWTVVYRRGLGWDVHTATGRPITYR